MLKSFTIYRSLLLIICAAFLLQGCASPPAVSENNQLVAEYNAAIVYLNLVEGSVDTQVTRYSDYFGLENELTFAIEGEYLTAPSIDETIFQDFDATLERYEKLGTHQDLTDALRNTNETAKQVISKVCSISNHCEKKEYETDQGESLRGMHREFISLLDRYLDASDQADRETAKIKALLDEKALQYTEENKLAIQHNILQFSLSVDNILQKLENNLPDLQSDFETAQQALSAFQSAILDSSQVKREGYQESSLSSLFDTAKSLLDSLEQYRDGETDLKSLNIKYNDFILWYNNTIYRI